MKKYLITILITSCIFISFFLLKKPVQSGELVCLVNTGNAPQKSVYVELLVQQEELGNSYVDCNKTMSHKNNIPLNSEIINFNKDGYVSYSYHHKSASSISKLSDCDTTYDDDMSTMLLLIFWNGIDKVEIEEVSNIAFAYVTETGKVLQITNKIQLNPIFTRDFININGTDVSVDYSGIKSSVICAMFLFLILLETITFVLLTQKEKRNQSKDNQGTVSVKTDGKTGDG